jgi:hypothetical protein
VNARICMGGGEKSGTCSAPARFGTMCFECYRTASLRAGIVPCPRNTVTSRSRPVLAEDGASRSSYRHSQGSYNRAFIRRAGDRRGAEVRERMKGR